jgi:ATP/maltotriose-dependent transcriptional regulator MalT
MLYGREDAQHRIGDLLAEARAGRGQALVIRGEAGVGKSALLHEMAACDEGVTVLRAAGVESEVELAFSGLHQLLSPVLTHAESLPELQAAALQCALGADDGQATDLLICAAVLNLLRQAARVRPLVIVVDDAQNLDRASLLVLLFAARRLAGHAVGALLAVREPDRRAVDTADLPQLRLARLAREPAARLLDSLGWEVDGPTRDALVEATGGNPLALTELARNGQREQLVVNALLTRTVPVDEALRDLFAGRVSSLPAASRQALVVAAAEGSARFDLVRAVCGRLGLPANALEAAEAAGLFTVVDRQMRFGHPLIRSAVYSGASSRHRRQAHAAIADELDARQQASLARWHRALATAGPDERLATALDADARELELRGGLAATASLLHEAARLSGTPAASDRRTAAAAHAAWKSGHASLARSYLKRIPENGAGEAATLTRTRLRGLVELYSGDQSTAYEYLSRNADLQHRTHPDHAAELWFMAVDAATHANRLDDAVTAAERIAALEGDPAWRTYGTWLASSVLGDGDGDGPDPWRVLDAAPAAIRRSGAHRWLMPMAISRHISDPGQVREFGLDALRHLRDAGMLAIVAIPMPWLVELEQRLGRWPDAVAHAEEGLRAARDIGQTPRVADFLSLLALLAADRGDEADCRIHARQALEVALPVRNHLAAAQATWALGRLDLARGEHEAASERLAGLRVDGLIQAHDHVARLAVADAVEAHLRAGHREQASLLTDAFEQSMGPNAPRWAESHLHRCRALLADDDSADKQFHLALSSADIRTRPFERARTALLHGQWLRRNRLAKQAQPPLRLSAELFDSLGTERWAQRARVELRACGGSAPRPGTQTESDLTGQELQVARLAASGLSNREIGAQLFLSPRTVGYHLHKIFPKLGISSRSQLRHLDLGQTVGHGRKL